MLKKTITFFMILLIILSMQPLFPKADELTQDDRRSLIENAKNLLYGEKPTKGGYFGEGLYADNERVVFTHVVLNVDDMRNPASLFVYRYDFESKTHKQMIPYEFCQIVPHTYKSTLDIPKQWGVFKRGGGSVLIEMDYVRGTGNEIVSKRNRDVQWIPNSNWSAHAYPQNGFEHNNPDLFGLDVVDVKTGERKTILSQIKCQSHPVSSWGSKLDYLFLNENTLLYSETMNPYRITDEFLLGDRFYEKDKSKHPYNALWRLNFISGDKIQLATCDLQVMSHLNSKGRSIIWNDIDIGSATDIIQRKK